MTRKVVQGVLLGLIGAGAVAAQPGVFQPKGRARPDEARDFRSELYGGSVTAVTRDSITIAYPGAETTRLHFSPEGKLIRTEAIRIPPEPPRRFRVSEPLAAGKFDPDCTGFYSYRLSDVQVGDLVSIRYSRVGGVDVCEHISIQRRPGGRVPPAPGQRPTDPVQWHEWMNAQQDFEEKGIPIPDKYLPHCPGIDEQRIAPMPRLVTPKAPPPKP